jgi:mono/diheme cytochrome c family protein
MPDPILLVEAGGSGRAVPVIILLVALVGFALAYFVVGPGKRKGPKRYADIPLAMRPYHSDEELETTGMERAMSWGVALATFCALFIPLYWLIEPTRIENQVQSFYEQDVADGRVEYQNACAQCHGSNLEGGSAPHPDPDIDVAWPAPRLDNIVARYEESEVVEDVRDFMRLTIERGRPGTPMPEFSVGFGGTYSDQQISAMITYILSVQTGEVPEIDAEAFVGQSGEDLFANHCATCHGPEGQGLVGPQLTNVFERYGWDPDDPDSADAPRDVILHAMQYGRNVSGKAPMPSFDQKLPPEAMQEIIDHIETFQVTGGPSFGQIGGDPVRAEDDDEGEES